MFDPFLTLRVPALRLGETWLPLVRLANPGRVPVTFTRGWLSGVFQGRNDPGMVALPGS